MKDNNRLRWKCSGLSDNPHSCKYIKWENRCSICGSTRERTVSKCKYCNGDLYCCDTYSQFNYLYNRCPIFVRTNIFTILGIPIFFILVGIPILILVGIFVFMIPLGLITIDLQQLSPPSSTNRHPLDAFADNLVFGQTPIIFNGSKPYQYPYNLEGNTYTNCKNSNITYKCRVKIYTTLTTLKLIKLEVYDSQNNKIDNINNSLNFEYISEEKVGNKLIINGKITGTIQYNSKGINKYKSLSPTVRFIVSLEEDKN